MINSLKTAFLLATIASLALILTTSHCLAQAPPLDGGLSGGFGGGLGGGFGSDSPAKFKVEAQFTAGTGDQPGMLYVTATMDPGWHIYSITQAPGGPLASKITIAEDPEKFEVLPPFQASPQPHKKSGTVFGPDLVVETHEKKVVWYAPLKIAAGVDPATLQISGGLYAQACKEVCDPPRTEPFVARLGEGVEIAGEPGAEEVIGGKITPQNRPKDGPLLKYIGLALIGGLLLNLMPCVLPVIGLKIISFVEQAGHSRAHAFMLNLWYALGMLLVFAILATVAMTMGLGWGQLLSYNGFNITMAAIVFVMALSFLGVWEIPIPGFVGRGKMAEAGEKEGVAGAFTKGIITTILATPCTGPFMGTALAWTQGKPPATIYAVFMSLGLGMALPYLLIGAFPKLIRFMPKPGAWMDTFKQIMGFVLLGTVVYIFTFILWPAMVPTMGFLFSLWAACWWINRTPITAPAMDRVRTWLEAFTFAGIMWILMFPGIDEIVSGRFAMGGLHDVMVSRFDSEYEEKKIDESVLAEILKDAKVDPSTLATEESELPWVPYTTDAFNKARVNRKTVIVDFTADWCMTCKTLEKFVLNTPKVRKAVEAGGIIPFKADWTHGAADEEVTALMEQIGTKQVPMLAIFSADKPNEPFVFYEAYSQTSLLEKLEEAGPSKE